MDRIVQIFALVFCVSSVFGQSLERFVIEGWVFDFQSEALIEAEVALLEVVGNGYVAPRKLSLASEIQWTDEQGRFHFEGEAHPRHDLILVARKPGLAVGWHYLRRSSKHEVEIRSDYVITLEEPHNLEGRVLQSDGRPLAGALVQAVAQGPGPEIVEAPNDWLTITTDDQGRFSFTHLPIAMQVLFYVQVPGWDLRLIFPSRYSTGDAGEGYNVDWKDVELLLPPVSTVIAEVFEKGTGRGMAGIRWRLAPELVRFQRQSERNSSSPWRYLEKDFTSGPDGSIRITGVPPGRHKWLFLQPETATSEWVGYNRVTTVPVEPDTMTVRLPMERGMPLEIRARDAQTGKALGDMIVQVTPLDFHIERLNEGFIQYTKTDANGMTRLYVPKGPHRLDFSGDNYWRWPGDGDVVNVASTDMAPVTLSIPPAVPLIRGTVIDGAGAPASGAWVKVAFGQEVLTDDQGQFIAVQNAGYPTKIVVARDVRRNLVGISRVYDARRRLRIPLVQGLTITGRIVGRSKLGFSPAGIPAARVSLHLHNPRQQVDWILIAEALTDVNGHYRLETVWPLRGTYAYTVEVIATGYGPTRYGSRDKGKAGETQVLPDIALAPADASVSGVLLDRAGRPVPEATISAFSDTGYHEIWKHTSTDEQGRFVINRIAEGPVRLQAHTVPNPNTVHVNAHSGDYVEMIEGGGDTYYLSNASRVGSRLPDLTQMEIGFDTDQISNKRVLVCFADIRQRTSQVSVTHLNGQERLLRQHGVEVVCIQVPPMKEAELAEWRKEHKVRFPIVQLPGNPEKVKQQWGVRSLPWLFLTDSDHRIVGEGIQTHLLNEFIEGSVVFSHPVGSTDDAQALRQEE